MLLTHYQSQEYQKLLSFSYTFLMAWFLVRTLWDGDGGAYVWNLISLQNIATQGLSTHFRAFINK